MSKKQKYTLKSFKIFIIVQTLLVLGLAGNSIATIYLWQKNKDYDNRYLTSLIVGAIDDINQPIPIDTTGRLYIPTFRLSMPSPDSVLGEVVYNDAPESEGEVRLASKNAMAAARSPLLKTQDNTEAMFAAVPKLQSCARGLLITFKSLDGQEAAATKLLADGRTAHFYEESACRSTKLLEFARQIESY